MSRSFTVVAHFLGVFGLIAVPVYAQPADVPAEVVVRPGDTIEWRAVDEVPHQVHFGAPGTTPLAEAKAILEFDSTLGLDDAGLSKKAGTGTLLKAKVKDTAQEGKTFAFACNVHPGNRMLSLPFKIAAEGGEPARTHLIFGESTRHWHLHVDITP
jgi:plastocyanin